MSTSTPLNVTAREDYPTEVEDMVDKFSELMTDVTEGEQGEDSNKSIQCTLESTKQPILDSNGNVEAEMRVNKVACTLTEEEDELISSLRKAEQEYIQCFGCQYAPSIRFGLARFLNLIGDQLGLGPVMGIDLEVVAALLEQEYIYDRYRTTSNPEELIDFINSKFDMDMDTVDRIVLSWVSNHPRFLTVEEYDSIRANPAGGIPPLSAEEKDDMEKMVDTILFSYLPEDEFISRMFDIPASNRSQIMKVIHNMEHDYWKNAIPRITETQLGSGIRLFPSTFSDEDITITFVKDCS